MSENEIMKLPEFKGNDLMPLDFLEESDSADKMVGRENLDQSDIVMPNLILLQAKSPAVEEDREGAKPGRFIHSTTEEILEGPIRGIAIFHNKSRQIRKDDAEKAGVEPCWSVDGTEGAVHGSCRGCPYAKWNPTEGRKKPWCSEANEITLVLAGFGPVRVRFAGGSYKAGKNFIGAWIMSRKNLWHHPIVLSSRQDVSTAGGHRYWQSTIQWDRTTVLTESMREKAKEFYEQISGAFEGGRLKTASVDEDIAF